MGRDAYAWKLISEIADISTHTPAWGVTEWADMVLFANYISTHTPAWGVTCISYS